MVLKFPIWIKEFALRLSGWRCLGEVAWFSSDSPVYKFFNGNIRRGWRNKVWKNRWTGKLRPGDLEIEIFPG